MTSTSNSNSILNVKDLYMSFDAELFKTTSLRERFVRTLTFRGKLISTHQVLKGINFELNKGDKLGVLGVNGSGKTTLCRLISGVLASDSGEINLSGECRSIFNTTIGVIPELTGRENAKLLVHFLFPREPVDVQNKLLEDALEFSELKEFLDIPFQNYSKGMQARLCLSVISAKECDLLILDEVFDGADLFFQEKVRQRISNVIEKSGATILVSHTLDQIRAVCNKVMVLDNGRIQYFGDVEKGIKAYRFLDNGVASFRGEI
jgi:ABC-type polysaccharide/polyol phosphate transport system ATPase subunit